MCPSILYDLDVDEIIMNCAMAPFTDCGLDGPFLLAIDRPRSWNSLLNGYRTPRYDDPPGHPFYNES